MLSFIKIITLLIKLISFQNFIFCFAKIGGVVIERSKSKVIMNLWPPPASYTCGNFSDTSLSKGLMGFAFTVHIRTENRKCPSQTGHGFWIRVELVIPARGELTKRPTSNPSLFSPEKLENDGSGGISGLVQATTRKKSKQKRATRYTKAKR